MKKIILLVFILTFIACDKDERIDSSLKIQFSHTIDKTEIFSCCSEINPDSLIYTNEAGQAFNILTLKYIISNLKIYDTNNKEHLLKDVHYIDASETENTSITFNDLDIRNYNKLTFTFGLNQIENIDNQYLNESWHNNMFWPNNSITTQPGGYHYMKLEGFFDTISQSYRCHTGPTFGGDYSFELELPIEFDANQNEKHQLTLKMNILNWFKTPNNYVLTSNGIMDNPTAQESLKENGLNNVFSIQE